MKNKPHPAKISIKKEREASPPAPLPEERGEITLLTLKRFAG